MTLNLIHILLLSQIILIPLGLSIFLFFFNRRLRNRSHEIMNRFNKMVKKHKKIQGNLKAEIKSLEEQQQTSEPDQEPDFIEIVGGELDEMLNRSLLLTEERLKSLGVESKEIEPDQSAEILAATMRYQFLEAEKQVLAFTNDTQMLWETLQPCLDKIALSLQTEAELTSQPLTQSATTDTELEELKQQITHLKIEVKHKTQKTDEIITLWNEKQPLIQQAYERLLRTTRRAPQQTEAHKQLDQLCNEIITLGSTIVDQELDKVDSAYLMEEIPDPHTEEKQSNVIETNPVQNDSIGKVITTTTKKDIKKINKVTPKVTTIINNDVKDLKTVVTKQRGIIKTLCTRIDELETEADKIKFIQEYEQQAKQLEQLLDESDNRITSLESDLTISNEKMSILEQELHESNETLALLQQQLNTTLNTTQIIQKSESEPKAETEQALSDLDSLLKNNSDEDDEDELDVSQNTIDSNEETPPTDPTTPIQEKPENSQASLTTQTETTPNDHDMMSKPSEAEIEDLLNEINTAAEDLEATTNQTGITDTDTFENLLNPKQAAP